MRLVNVRKTRRLTLEAAGRELGCARETLRRYELPAGHPEFRVPPPDMMDRIWRWSDGQVGPADFYELPAIDVSTQAAGDSAAPPCSNSRPDGAHPAARPILSNGELAEGGAA